MDAASRTRSRWKLVGFVALALVAVPLAWLAASSLAGRSRLPKLRAEHERRLEAYATDRHARPVLRPPEVEGNAAEALHAALKAMKPLDASLLSKAGDELKEGRASPDVLVFASERAATLALVREATHRTWAYTVVDVRSGIEAVLPDFKPSLVALKLLVATSTQADGAACLQISLDALRAAQDLAPGAGLIGQMISAAALKFTVPALLHCVPRADRDARLAAARELRVLAASAPPMVSALLAESLALASTLRHQYETTPLVPASAKEVQGVFMRSWALGGWETLLGNLDAWDGLRAVPYPDAFTRVAELTKRQALEGGFFLEIGTPDYERFVQRDAEALALLRAAALALDAVVLDPVADPASRQDPTLRDPFSGASLLWRPGSPGVKPAIYSVGPDRTDNGGTGDDVLAALD